MPTRPPSPIRVALAWLIAAALGVACGRGPFYDFGGIAPAVCATAMPVAPGGPPAWIDVQNCGQLAGALTFGCSDPGDCGPIARCNPRQGHTGSVVVCCSDDPATFTGELPDYAGRGIGGGDPIFSGDNNALGTKGVCTRLERVDDRLRENGCPVPCNPTWNVNDVRAVCGAGRECCQTVPLGVRDCVLDPVTERWRPVTGLDIGVPGPDGSSLTDWGSARHETHQDAVGVACLSLAGASNQTDPLFETCIRQLTVADQRGLCVDAGQCCVEPDFVDACEAMN